MTSSIPHPLIIATTPLRAWVSSILVTCGVPPADAKITADVLVDANAAGIETHGVARLNPYVGLLRAGHVNSVPRFVCEERAGALVFDADRGLGQVAGLAALAETLKRAERQAIVGMTISHVGHLGALGHFTGLAAGQGMIAILVQNGPPMMGLPGSMRPAIGNNPLAFSLPVSGGPPVVFDIATSEAAYGKVIEAARAGRAIPESWALDSSGRPTTDAAAALIGTLLPAGGHKGIGLSMLVECLAGSLTGMVPRHARPEGSGMPAYFGAFLLVANPALLIGRDNFDSHVGDWLGVYKAAAAESRYPGERLASLRRERESTGIPLGREIASELKALGEDCGVPFPEPVP